MELKTFVAESLTQILEGIRDAQKRPDGSDVAAEGYFSSKSNLVSGGASGFFTVVDFDVSVVAESKEGGTKVRIADFETSAEPQQIAQNTNRLKFSVHVRLPKGGANRMSSGSGNFRAQTDYDPFA